VSPASQPVIAARIALGPDLPSHDPLFDAIPKRRTNRGPYRDQSIAGERLRELAHLVSSPTVRVLFLSDEVALRDVGALIVEATERIISDPDMSLDSFRWIRTGRRDVLAQRDGVTIDTAGAGQFKTVAAKILPNLDAAAIDRIWLDATRATQTATAPVFGLILVPDRLDMANAIAAGRAWQRLHLAATVLGLAAQPLNQPVEMIDRRQMLGRQDEFGSGLARFSSGWEPTFVFRLGYAERQAPHSPRRPLEDVVIAGPLATVGL
jgi:nitroreductase